MRINVYNEELTTELEFVSKHVEATGNTYYGLRMFMKSAPELHHEPNDDDRTAITFWFGTKLAALGAVSRWYASVVDDMKKNGLLSNPLDWPRKTGE